MNICQNTTDKKKKKKSSIFLDIEKITNGVNLVYNHQKIPIFYVIGSLGECKGMERVKMGVEGRNKKGQGNEESTFLTCCKALLSLRSIVLRYVISWIIWRYTTASTTTTSSSSESWTLIHRGGRRGCAVDVVDRLLLLRLRLVLCTPNWCLYKFELNNDKKRVCWIR